LSEHDVTLTPEDRGTLLETAAASVEHGVRTGRSLPVELARYSHALQQPRACFVTLHRGGELRGCIGVLEPRQPLIAEVAANAFSAAFRDPRFNPVAGWELGDLTVHVAVLTPARPMHFRDEADLLAQLRPGVDGLVLEDAGHRGTFLPSVWESLPDPQDFWLNLKRKAGLPLDHWSPTLSVKRYETLSIPD
jgi:AmmeMemoRadiSam system protein A